MLIVVHIGRTNCATCGFLRGSLCAHLIVTGSVAAEDLEKKARARAGKDSLCNFNRIESFKHQEGRDHDEHLD